MKIIIAIATLVIMPAVSVTLPSSANAALPGDVNGDGVVSMPELQAVINAFLGVTAVPVTAGFTNVMISGNAYIDSNGSVIKFGSDGTFFKANTSGVNMAWSIDSSGHLIVTNPGSGTGFATITLLSGSTASGLNFSVVNSDNSTGTGTLTLVPPSNSTFSSTMITDKAFVVSNSLITFNSNYTISGVGANTSGETWSINPSGQLLIYNTSKGTATITIITGDVSKGWTCTVTYSAGTPIIEILALTTSATTVTDPATSLMWVKADDGVKRNWYDAGNYCSSLSTGGFGGWRLPSKAELEALDKSTVFNQLLGTTMAQIDGQWIGSYWSSTSFDSTQAYHVFFTSGSGSGYASKTFYANLVRCVRP